MLGVNESCVHSLYSDGCPAGPYAFGPGRPSNACGAFHFWSTHIGGGHFLYAAGLVQFLLCAAAAVLPALATRAEGSAVPDPW